MFPFKFPCEISPRVHHHLSQKPSENLWITQLRHLFDNLARFCTSRFDLQKF